MALLRISRARSQSGCGTLETPAEASDADLELGSPYFWLSPALRACRPFCHAGGSLLYATLAPIATTETARMVARPVPIPKRLPNMMPSLGLPACRGGDRMSPLSGSAPRDR